MVVDEVMCLAEVVLCAEPDDFDRVCILSSELLDVGSFPSANRSMRCPHPEQHHFVGRYDVAQIDLVAECDIVENNIGKDVRLDFGFWCDRRFVRGGGSCRGLGWLAVRT